MEKRSSGFNIEFLLLAAVLGLVTIGVIFIYSSGVRSNGELASSEYIKQIIWGIIALVVMLSFAFFNYNILKDLSPWIYIGLLVLLFITLFVGRVVNGAKAWIGIGELGGQPSEFMKIFTVLFLARFLNENRQKMHKLPTFLLGLVIILIPVVFILRQPDLGTAMVFFPIYFVMAYFAGAKIRHIMFLLLTGVLTVVFIVFPAFEEKILANTHSVWAFLMDPFLLAITMGSSSIILGISLWGYFKYKQNTFYWLIFAISIFMLAVLASFAARQFLQDYQIKRLIVFINPYIEERSAGWNLIQSLTAVGNGGLFGKGFLQGTQSHYQFLPMQSTDFIFSILSEELGFFGVLLVFSLFLIIILRSLFIMNIIKDSYGLLVIAGFVGMFATHIFINIGMAIGILPITGIPLYFLSYGGSSLIAASLAIGIIMNISSRRFMF